MRLRVGVVWNLGAGAAQDARAMQRVRELLAQTACEVEMSPATHGNGLREAGLRLLESGCDVLVAAGGDGTVSSVASLLVDNRACLGVLPVGTLNHFARDLGIPFEIEAACRVIVEGHSRAVDMGEINGRYFVNNSSLGLYPSIVRRREQVEKTGYNRLLAFAAGIFYALRRYPFLDIGLRADGDRYSLRSPFILIGNNDYEIEGLGLGRRLRLDGGNLALYTAQRAGRLGLLWIAFAALTRRLRRNRDFRILSARELTIETKRKRVSVALDGEVIHLEPPLCYRISQGPCEF